MSQAFGALCFQPQCHLLQWHPDRWNFKSPTHLLHKPGYFPIYKKSHPLPVFSVYIILFSGMFWGVFFVFYISRSALCYFVAIGEKGEVGMMGYPGTTGLPGLPGKPGSQGPRGEWRKTSFSVVWGMDSVHLPNHKRNGVCQEKTIVNEERVWFFCGLYYSLPRFDRSYFRRANLRQHCQALCAQGHYQIRGSGHTSVLYHMHAANLWILLHCKDLLWLLLSVR